MFETGVWNRLFPVSQWMIKFVPLRKAPDVEFKSDEFEIGDRSHNTSLQPMPEVRLGVFWPPLARRGWTFCSS
jgi:hypothetical protein